MNRPDDDQSDPVEISVNGVLDLHAFRPSEVSSLVAEYLAVCLEKGIFSIRSSTGKGQERSARRFTRP